MEAAQNKKGSILKFRVPPLWPTYIGERRTTFAKAYGIKVRCYGEHVGEHIGNLGNILGTQGKMNLHPQQLNEIVFCINKYISMALVGYTQLPER
jgi:hypothetical protein